MTRYTHHVGGDARLVAMAHTVRRAVFIDEQGVTEAEEMDGKDGVATHIVVTDDSEPVATARFRFVEETTARIERVAVLSAYRGEGLGASVMETAESMIRERGATSAFLHGQLRVAEFYERLGYEAVGEQFEEAGIPHVEMVKPLD
ncbi:GNAT family N-acetyltransferase [Haloarcula sp. S1CR25-12]|uniref:GNAT family N-acetyltransferase n=1 Tax=Haloarcula saliterrae TaxID=2950534 RepID=A0ABU2FB33_9EURY|nr:GNAT family N-acetyltransferase [Haloarcula sp. S1CR25-12]MDS0258920.1 GNAT family N-acetyltransferase [Haloarcula sp. S1CR25-12]